MPRGLGFIGHTVQDSRRNLVDQLDHLGSRLRRAGRFRVVFVRRPTASRRLLFRLARQLVLDRLPRFDPRLRLTGPERRDMEEDVWSPLGLDETESLGG